MVWLAASAWGGALLLGPFNTPLPWWERQAHEKKSIRSNKQGLKHGVLRTDQWRGKESEQTETKTARVALRSALRCTAVFSWSLPCGYICGYSKTMKCSATQVMCSLYLYLYKPQIWRCCKLIPIICSLFIKFCCILITFLVSRNFLISSAVRH